VKRNHRPWQGGKKRTKPLSNFERQIKKLDAHFSLFVRLSNADDRGMCKCISCGKEYYYKNSGKHLLIGAGHFIPKKNNTYRTRWDPENVKPQCTHCNSYLEGNKYAFGTALNKMHGPGTTEKLLIKATKPFNRDIFDMEKHIEYYKAQDKELERKFLKQTSLL